MSSIAFTCQHCLKFFKTNWSLRRHSREQHRGLTLPDCLRRGRRSQNATPPTIKCSSCPLTFNSRRGLNSHRKTRHSVQPNKQRRCSEVIKLHFDTEREFYEWKAKIEKATTSSYVKRRKETKFGTVIRRQFYCHRSGAARSRTSGLRHCKIQGSCKIGVVCPSAIFSRVSEAGDVNVTYYSEHFGHSCDVAHQQLTRDERTQVAGLLAMGVPYDDVLHRMQLSGDNSSVSRLHFLTKHDLNNITRDFNLSKGITHCTNDADSVAAWVALNQRNGEQSLVRYIKFQGESDEEHGLSADDFMLVIMSEAQIAGLQQLYHPKKEVAMDSTHGTNAYDYQLTTLMTTDEHGEGFPIAFCFSNRVDEVAMRTFLTICKRTIGRSIDDAVLMTDDAEVYANAWVQVMGPPAHRLLCTWHIDRAWRKNLHKIEGDSFLKATVYKTLRAMMEIRDVDIFRERLKEFVEAAASDSKTEKFGIYFHNEYASRPQLWAFCHRLGLRVHHNMHLEALHRVLKHVHMKGQKVRRMDKCIYALLRFMRSKMHDRLLKVHKGKWTRHLSGIRNRHKRGVLCDRSLVSVVRSDQVYAVRGRKGEMYIVEQNDSMPHSSTTCPLRCEPCNICVHTFVCNCVDAGLRYTICKHVHLVVSTFKPVVSCTVEELAWESQPSDTAPSMETESQNEDDDFMSSMSVASEELVRTNRAGSLNESEVILQDFSSQQMQNDVLRDIAAAERDWTSIRAEMDDNAEIAAAVREQMGRLKALVTALKNKPQLRPMSLPQEPTNKKVTKQRYFMSTKRKPKKRNAESTICKPDCKEKQFLLATLAGNVEVVSSARTTTDHNYEADTRDVIAFEHSY